MALRLCLESFQWVCEQQHGSLVGKVIEGPFHKGATWRHSCRVHGTDYPSKFSHVYASLLGGIWLSLSLSVGIS
jgi:hypothetical protein